jgi:hypothetical protein
MADELQGLSVNERQKSSAPAKMNPKSSKCRSQIDFFFDSKPMTLPLIHPPLLPSQSPDGKEIQAVLGFRPYASYHKETANELQS